MVDTDQGKLLKNSDFKIQIEPANEISLEYEKLGDWDFFWNVERMLSSKEMDIIADKVKINRLPDMLFGNNRFYIVNGKNNLILEINPLKMLDLCNFKLREEKLFHEKKISNEEKLNAENDLNFVYYIPIDVKVQYYDKWKNLKVEREDVKKIDPVEDWTFSSCYMGTVSNLDTHPIFNSNSILFKNFDPFKKYKPIEIKKTEDTLPINRLGQENPIVKYMEINLFDDELCDNGLSMGNFR